MLELILDPFAVLNFYWVPFRVWAYIIYYWFCFDNVINCNCLKNFDGEDRPYADLIVWTSQFGYVYLPSTVVPVGKTKRGLPIGIQVVGPYLGDRTTIEFAKYIEQLLGGYEVPPLAKIN